MKDDSEILTIGAFAKAAGVNVETIRFYQLKGLLPLPERTFGRIRRYGRSAVARVKFVKSAQRLGFSLDEVGQLLMLEDGTHCSDAADLAAHRLTDVRARIADLMRMEAALSNLVGECNAHDGNVSCPLIAALLLGGSRHAAAQSVAPDK